jgi:hypothetical protein
MMPLQTLARCETKEKVLESDNKQLKEELSRWKARASELQDKYGGAGVDPVEHENVRTQLAASTTQLAAANASLADAGKARDAVLKVLTLFALLEHKYKY